MVRLTILRWLFREERTISHLAKSCGVSDEALVEFLAGTGAADAAMLTALEQAMDLAEGSLQQAADEEGAKTGDGDPLRCFTVDEVAARMKVHPDTVRKEINQGKLRHIVVGDRGKRVPWNALEERLAQWE